MQRPISSQSVNRNHNDLYSGQTADSRHGMAEDSLGVFGCSTARGKMTRNRKTRSLYGVNPSSKLGPKGTLCQGATLTIQDPSAQQLQWCKQPLTALIICKPHDLDIKAPYREVVNILLQKELIIYIEEGSLKYDDMTSENRARIKEFVSYRDNLTEKIDFIITLGGDGTLIHAGSLFQQSVPPVLAFNLGSLGFLTPFHTENMRASIDSALTGNIALTLRSRLKCVMCSKEQHDGLNHVKELENGNHKNPELTTYSVLNDVVVDRGPSPYLCMLDLYVDRKHVTSVQGDGLIISTPTGSTAYATAAGASMIHPSVPAILITPICPHSLSFRPIVLPAGVEITVTVSPDARQTAWAAFDGRNRQEMKHGDSLRITTSIYPLPSICAQSQLSDWFNSLADCLHWNVRRPQKSFQSSSNSNSMASSISELSLGEDLSE